MSQKRLANSPPERPQKKPDMAPPKALASADPQREGTRVIIEVCGINDQDYFGILTDEELAYIWEKTFHRSKEDIFGMKTKRSLSRHFRAIFVLNGKVDVKSIFPESFVFKRPRSDTEFDTIHCRVIGSDKPRPAEIGQLARVTANTVDFTVSPDQVLAWLAKFGTVNSSFNYIRNSIGIRTDDIEVEVKLQEHIPEYIPVAGKKVLINYPCIPKMCIKCYKPGHMKRNCKSRKVEWIDKVDQMRKTGRFEDSLFGEWIPILDSRNDA